MTHKIPLKFTPNTEVLNGNLISKWIYFSKKFVSLWVIVSLCEVLNDFWWLVFGQSGSKTSMKFFYIYFDISISMKGSSWRRFLKAHLDNHLNKWCGGNQTLDGPKFHNLIQTCHPHQMNVKWKSFSIVQSGFWKLNSGELPIQC